MGPECPQPSILYDGALITAHIRSDFDAVTTARQVAHRLLLPFRGRPAPRESETVSAPKQPPVNL
jgi:hypothetical protein